MRHLERMVFSTESVVPVTLTYPAPLTRQEFDEVKDVLALWLRSMERRCSDSNPATVSAQRTEP